MIKPKKLVVSHAPFWHDSSDVSQRHYHIILAALPAVIFGLFQYGGPAVGVISLSVSFAIFWELLMNYLTRRPITIGDGNAALVGLLFGMMLPATVPWWLVVTGTFVALVIGKHIFGGIGGNPFNPALIGVAILTLSWKDYFNFDNMLVNYDFDFTVVFPLMAAKSFGVEAVSSFSPGSLLMGQQIGGIGSTFGLGLIAGGLYLIARGFIRWEICLSFLAGILVTAFLFNLFDASRYAGPAFHLLTGYTLIGAFFLATEDSSSPVNMLPMLIYGAGGGILTVLIRNIGFFTEGVVFAILMMNILNPLLDKIRPQAIGKGV